jgi:hypothetical protein
MAAVNDLPAKTKQAISNIKVRMHTTHNYKKSVLLNSARIHSKNAHGAT